VDRLDVLRTEALNIAQAAHDLEERFVRFADEMYRVRQGQGTTEDPDAERELLDAATLAVLQLAENALRRAPEVRGASSEAISPEDDQRAVWLALLALEFLTGPPITARTPDTAAKLLAVDEAVA
jgi:hypothetical protein